MNRAWMGSVQEPDSAVRQAEDPLALIRTKIAAKEIPVRLRSNVREHCERLGGLVDRLQCLGMDRVAINAHVLDIYEAYERELIRCIAEQEAGEL